jgi:hypothetical protein
MKKTRSRKSRDTVPLSKQSSGYHGWVAVQRHQVSVLVITHRPQAGQGRDTSVRDELYIAQGTQRRGTHRTRVASSKTFVPGHISRGHVVLRSVYHSVSTLFCIYFFGGLHCLGDCFAYVAQLVFWRDVWIRAQRAA